MKRLLRWLTTFIVLSATPAQAVSVCPALPHNTLPTQDSNFISNLQTFLCQDAGDQYVEQFHDFVFSGGFVEPPVPTGLSVTLGAPTIATIEGFYVHDANSITLTDNSECWVIMDVETSGTGGAPFTRHGSTHYLSQCVPYGSPKPALPTGTVWLTWIKTGGGSVTETIDLRTRVPWGRTVQLTGELPNTDRRVDLAYSQEDGCLYADTGADGGGWTALWDSRYAQMATVNAPYDPPNLVGNANNCDSFTFAGVSPGFRCIATHYVPGSATAGLNAGSILISAQASGTDTVRVCYLNLSVVSINADDGIMRITCWR